MSYAASYAGQPALGFVYVMECAGFYKIGWSKQPGGRHSSIQVGNPLPVTLIGVVEGTPADEDTWHEVFKGKRARGEWFSLTDEDVNRILHEDTGIDYLPGEDEIA
jgi:hypothetical protein